VVLLTRETASIELWLEIALMYYRNGRTDAFQMILSEALKDGGIDFRIVNKHLFDNEKQRIKAMNALAGH